MSTHNIIGNKESFAISYEFFDETRETELSMFIDGQNILEFERNGQNLTTRWNLDDLVEWLRRFIDNMAEDPFPFEVGDVHQIHFGLYISCGFIIRHETIGGFIHRFFDQLLY